MTPFLFVTDLHGSRWKYERTLALAKATGAELVVNGGDISPHGRRHEDQERFYREFLGMEITEQLGREPSRILACCGGGGLSAGLAIACPTSEIVPVEPVGWDQLGQSLEAGEIIRQGPNPPTTICDALQPMAPAPINLDILVGRAEPGLTVTDKEVRAAQRFAFAQLRLVVEPGGAAALAVALSGKAELDENTVIIITGGNVDPQKFAETIASHS